MECVQASLEEVDKRLPEEKFDETPIILLKEQYNASRSQAMSSAIDQAVELVGDELAY